MNEGRAHEVYAAMIAAALGREYDRKQSLEQRGLAVISTAGTLISLILGFAIFAGSQVSQLPLSAKVLLALGLVAFLLASVFKLEICRPTSGYYTPVAVKGSTACRRAGELDR
jgi:hypothetical protein